MNKKSTKYTPDIVKLNRVCERNYYLINLLVPDWEPLKAKTVFETSQASVFQIQILEVSRYTNLVEIQQLSVGIPDIIQPRMTVRVYHDAKMAEVVEFQNIGRIQPSYLYPNPKMHQPDEKTQINIFLYDWLSYCQSQGMATPVRVC